MASLLTNGMITCRELVRVKPTTFFGKYTADNLWRGPPRIKIECRQDWKRRRDAANHRRLGAVNNLCDPALSDHIRTHEAWLSGAVQYRLFQTADLQGFDGLLTCQHFGMSRQNISGRQLLDAFSDDFAAKNDDTPYRSISLRFGVASQLDATPHKLLVGACMFLHEWLSLFSNLSNFA
jgi:hypothetical protein